MAFTVVQDSNNGNGTNTAAATYTSNPVVGSTLVATVANITNTSVPTSVSDGTNTWVLIQSNNTTNTGMGVYIYAWYVTAAYGAAPTVTATLIAATMKINIYAFSGGFAATNGTAISFLDNSQRAIGGNTTLGTTTNGTQPSVTTTNSASMVFTTGIGSSSIGTSTTMTPGSGSTTPGYFSANTNTFLQDGAWIETNAGTYNPYISWASNRKVNQITVAFAPATSAQGNMMLAM